MLCEGRREGGREGGVASLVSAMWRERERGREGGREECKPGEFYVGGGDVNTLFVISLF